MTPETAKAKLITIVCGSELEARLCDDLKKLDCVTGYTLVRATGRGTHGPRTFGPVDAGNIRIEILVTPGHEQLVIGLLARSFEGDALTAFVQDVEAFPAKRFV